MSTLRSMNPATGAVVGEVEVTPIEVIPDVVARARGAQREWAMMALSERADVLEGAAVALGEVAEELGRLTTAEMGKPAAEALGEANAAANSFAREVQRVAEALAPDVLEGERTRSTVYWDPLGVAASITPWNFPVLMPQGHLLPALVAGNAVVFKPSEETPLVGQLYADALNRVLPDGVLEVIHGAREQGKALVAADVDFVVFTGSRAAGKHIMRAASDGLKRLVLELGGKDPLLVLDDADLAEASAFAARNSFRNAGQVCISTERIYVADVVYDEFLGLLAEHAAAMPVGDPMADGTRIGPMVHARQRDAVAAQVNAAIAAGASLAWQGPDLGGNFYPPTVLADVSDDADVLREETFGPVVSVVRVSSDDEAVERANDTPYGLGAVVYGGPERARAVARRLTAGMIGVNQGLASAPGAPWVGARESGYGFQGGREGHRQFTQARVLNEPKREG